MGNCCLRPKLARLGSSVQREVLKSADDEPNWNTRIGQNSEVLCDPTVPGSDSQESLLKTWNSEPAVSDAIQKQLEDLRHHVSKLQTLLIQVQSGSALGPEGSRDVAVETDILPILSSTADSLSMDPEQASTMTVSTQTNEKMTTNQETQWEDSPAHVQQPTNRISDLSPEELSMLQEKDMSLYSPNPAYEQLENYRTYRKLSVLHEESEELSEYDNKITLNKKITGFQVLNNNQDAMVRINGQTKSVKFEPNVNNHDNIYRQNDLNNVNGTKSKNDDKETKFGLNLPIQDPLTEGSWHGHPIMTPDLVSPESINSQILALTSPISPFSTSSYSLSLEDLETTINTEGGNRVDHSNINGAKNLRQMILFSENPIITTRRKNYMRSASLPCETQNNDNIHTKNNRCSFDYSTYRNRCNTILDSDFNPTNDIENDIYSMTDEAALISSEINEANLSATSHARPLQLVGRKSNPSGPTLQSIVGPSSSLAFSVIGGSNTPLPRRSSLNIPPGPAELSRVLRKRSSLSYSLTPECSPLSSPSYRTPPEGTPWSSPRPSLDTTAPNSMEWDHPDSLTSSFGTPFHTPRPSLVLESMEGIPSLVLVEGDNLRTESSPFELKRSCSERKDLDSVKPDIDGGSASLPFLPSSYVHQMPD